MKGTELRWRIDDEVAVISALRKLQWQHLPELGDLFFPLLDKVSKMLRDDLATYYGGADKGG